MLQGKGTCCFNITNRVFMNSKNDFEYQPCCSQYVLLQPYNYLYSNHLK